MSGPIIFLTEMALFTAAVCGLHAMKPRFGLAPLFLVMGIFEAFLFVAGKGNLIYVDLFASPPARASSIIFVPLILATLVLVYVLEGTAKARQLFIGLTAAYVVHGVVDVMLMYHVANPPPGMLSHTDSDVFSYGTRARFSSWGAILCDSITIIVTYQFTVNRFPKIPSAVPLFLGLVLAMAMDAIAYTTFAGEFGTVPEMFWLQKIQAGAAVGIPMAIYLDWMLRKHKDKVEGGILNRGSFDIFDLREELETERKRTAEMKETFSRYVSSDVVEHIVRSEGGIRLGGEKRDVTILFADIRGYSTISEQLEPEQVIDILNEYFGRVGAIILEQQGMINEFEGDAVLAVFGAPNALEDHAARAVLAAEQMIAAVEVLNDDWERDGTAKLWHNAGFDRLAIRIGLHSGPVVAGNIGSDQRMKYAVIGDTVNTASRVEGLNKDLDTSVLMTAATLERARHSPLLASKAFTDLGEKQVKGRAEPVHVYTWS